MTTPTDLQITPRDRRYGQDRSSDGFNLTADPITALLTALSCTFPRGERFFIESVNRFRNWPPEPLKSQIVSFVRQEALHTREHVAFNKLLEARGYDPAAIDAAVERSLARVVGKDPATRLAVTACMEHLTAVAAHWMLKTPGVLDGLPEPHRNLWRWHMLEEIEHKAVAFDVFEILTARVPRFRRWSNRSRAMWAVTIQFSSGLHEVLGILWRHDGVGWLGRQWALARLLFGVRGLVWGLGPHYLAFYRPGFHPWQTNDRDLIASTELSLAGASAEAA